MGDKYDFRGKFYHNLRIIRHIYLCSPQGINYFKNIHQNEIIIQQTNIPGMIAHHLSGFGNIMQKTGCIN